MIAIAIALSMVGAPPNGARCLAIADHLEGVTIAARRTFNAQFGLTPDANTTPYEARQRALDIRATETLVSRIRARYPNDAAGSAADLDGAGFAAWVRAGRACTQEP